jgi:hypothetical protein
VESQVRDWNKADWLLYEHFNRTLWLKIDEIGRDKVQREVSKLQKLVADLTKECVEGYVDNKLLPPEFRTYQPPGVRVRGIKVFFSNLRIKFRVI